MHDGQSLEVRGSWFVHCAMASTLLCVGCMCVILCCRAGIVPVHRGVARSAGSPDSAHGGRSCLHAPTESLQPSHAIRTLPRLRLRGGDDSSENHDSSGEDEGVQVFRTVDGYDLEPMPSFSVRTPDQDPGLDYGAHGFMFNIENTGTGTVLISGLQICSGDGTPHNYVLYTSEVRWQDAQHDPAAWTECGGGRRVYIPDHEHGVYGKLPMAPVEIAPQKMRAFYIHSDDDSASVGYRMLSDDDGGGEEFTDCDDNIRISKGRRMMDRYPFPAEGLEALDGIPRAFLGIVEYEMDPG